MNIKCPEVQEQGDKDVAGAESESKHIGSISIIFSDFSDILTVSELAQMLRIGRNNAYELVRAGIIPSIKIGRQIRISKQAVCEYIRQF